MTDVRDLYATLAQVFPVLLLTIVWDREWLTRLPPRVRRSQAAPHGVLFWTKPVVRWYSIVLATVLILAIAACVLVLAGTVADAIWLRVSLLASLALALVTLCVRIAAGVIEATR